jgi:hypothetical protein
MRVGMRPPSVSTVRFVVFASIVLTAFHFADNAISIETYPQPDWISEAVVWFAWPIYTAFGVAAYVLYSRGREELGAWFLLAYSFTGISSLGHFLSGSPDEFTTRGLISVFMDGAIGFAVLGVAIWALIAHRQQHREALEGGPA